ncbi:hypothetical protein NHX12_033159 [Muraenolepis orangiensis]|uniref:Transposase Tc1-like domain-containing protein n=1 Tax=Muraenolepis orangiensis TaxID=630683 RepID=A0A9Q0E2W0_9TELE|nr:hypothetical protein NHX12_033159 [Muraenolepis orangiensis]
MPKTKEISLDLRKTIVQAHDKGEGYTAIFKHFTVSTTAVRCIIAKYKETNSVRNKPGRGRKRKISRTLERKIARDVSKKPRTSAKIIVADLASSGVVVSRNTVVRALHRGGLHGHRPRKNPLLKELHIRARLRVAREQLKEQALPVSLTLMQISQDREACHAKPAVIENEEADSSSLTCIDHEMDCLWRKAHKCEDEYGTDTEPPVMGNVLIIRMEEEAIE